MSRSDAIDYCIALTRIESQAGRLPQGYVYRLPTEAEWIYAGRGGGISMTPLPVSQVYCMPGSGHRPRACGIGVPNAWGLYDMQGNASEWSLDVYTKTRAKGTTSPYAKPNDKTVEFMAMGGSWWMPPENCRLVSRRPWPDVPTYSIGFRPVLAPRKP